MFDSLDKVRADAQARLERAARDRRSPMHTPVIATGDADARVARLCVDVVLAIGQGKSPAGDGLLNPEVVTGP